MIPEPFQPTPYADINQRLGDLLAQEQAILGSHLVGIYLSGSLALGDFNPQRSDIDLVIVTDGPLADEHFAALQEMHALLGADGSRWAKKLEAIYVPKAAVRGKAETDALYPVLEAGCALVKDRLEDGWSVQWYTVREHGVVIAGPEPPALFDPVDPKDMRSAGKAIAETWQEEARTDPSWLGWLREPENQAFVILTLCRLLYTLEVGGVASKPGAGRWALRALDRRWAGLIERALAALQGDKDALGSNTDDTVALVQYTVDRHQQWERRNQSRV
jgi:hypothetical protein